MEKTLTNEGSLKLIEEMIQASKNNYKKHHGIYFLFWGYLSVAIVGLFAILRSTVGIPQAHYVWFLFLLGFVFNIVQAKKGRNSRPVVTKIDAIVGKIWLGVSFGMATLFGAGPVLEHYMFPLSLVVIAIATYAHGAIINFKPFIIGAFILLVTASISFYMPNIDVVLWLYVGGIFVGYIIPGHMLRNQKEASV
ncbi:MAG: hypothetical protein ACI9IP_002961 [Arcticibacterium sp.]|jgi:hypothetical protein